MYKGLKKRYTREEYVKLTLIKNENKCYFCLHNSENYVGDYGDEMFAAGLDYHDGICDRCIHYRNKPLYWHHDNFETLYDWE